MIVGFSDVKAVSSTTSLGDLGLDSLMGVEIKQILERDLDISLPIKDIRQLTIAKLQDMAANPGASSAEGKTDENLHSDRLDDSGVSLRLDPHHLMPEEDVVKMNSCVDSASHPVFLVHPVEGVITSLEHLACQLKCPVYGLQCTNNAPLTSLSDLAAFYIKVRQQISNSKKLLGSSIYIAK